MITRAWDCDPDGTPMFVATTKLKRCKKQLKSWSRDHFGNVKQQIKQAKDQLWHAEEVSTGSGDHEDVIRLKNLNVLYDKEEKMWQQRSKVQWLKNSDQNTMFFSWDCNSKEDEEFH